MKDDLSRLLDGELPPDDAASLRVRIEADPALARDWERLRALPNAFEALLHAPPPPALDAAVLARAGRRPGRPLRVLALVLLAAAALLFATRPRSVDVEVSEGLVRLDGQGRVHAGAVSVAIDGIAEVTVEPADGDARETMAGGEAMSRNGAVLAVAVTVVVLEGSAVVHAGDAAPTVLLAGQSTTIGAPPASAPPPAPIVDDARIRELEAQNALLQRLLEDADVEAHGTPIPWPAGLPEAFQPAGFERQVRKAVAECAPDVQIVGFECSEPPCFALLRAPGAHRKEPYGKWWDDLINECPAWTDFYTDGAAGGSGDVTCPDGRTERFNAWGWSPGLVTPPDGASAEERENASKRFMTRMEEIERTWPCASD